MPRRRHLGAAAALPLLAALSGCTALFSEPDVLVRTREVACPPRPPETRPCPALREGDTLGAQIETLRRRAECLESRDEAWHGAWSDCAQTIDQGD